MRNFARMTCWYSFLISGTQDIITITCNRLSSRVYTKSFSPEHIRLRVSRGQCHQTRGTKERYRPTPETKGLYRQIPRTKRMIAPIMMQIHSIQPSSRQINKADCLVQLDTTNTDAFKEKIVVLLQRIRLEPCSSTASLSHMPICNSQVQVRSFL